MGTIVISDHPEREQILSHEGLVGGSRCVFFKDIRCMLTIATAVTVIITVSITITITILFLLLYITTTISLLAIVITNSHYCRCCYA